MYANASLPVPGDPAVTIVRSHVKMVLGGEPEEFSGQPRRDSGSGPE